MESKDSNDRSILMANLYRWWRRFAFVAAILLVWFVLKWVGVVGEDVFNSSVYISAVILFFLAMPVSLVFRLDHLANHLSSQSSFVLQLVALLYVGANFSFLGFVQGYFRQWKANRAKKSEVSEARREPAFINGENGTH